MSQAAVAVANEVLREPGYMLWQDFRRDLRRVVQDQKGWGHHRIDYPAIQGADFQGYWTSLPTANAYADHREKGDVVYLSVEGDLEITVDGQRHVLQSLDMLAVPAHALRSIVNVGRPDGFYFAIYSDGKDTGGKQDPAAKPEHMTWTESRRDFHWTLPLAERWGYHRGSGPLIRPVALRGHLVRMPAAQHTPWHYAPRDLMFTVIDNEIEFSCAGRNFPLKPQDMLLIPAGTPYIYTNYTRRETLFLSIGGKLPPGRKSRYFTENPGWPPRPDAPTMEVEIDIYGDAKVVSGAPKD